LATALSIALAAHDLTHEELAARVGTSRRWIDHVVDGTGNPGAALKQKIADVFNVDPHDLFAEDTRAVVITFVNDSTLRSGVPPTLEDASTIEQIARTLRSQGSPDAA
jgi:transcriptional regulator with XRE-family HTH domain